VTLASWLAAALIFVGCGTAGSAPEPAAVDAGRKPRPGDPCTTRADCDDGVFCSGVEECLEGVCVSARNAACRAPSVCATATCEETATGCVFAAKVCDGALQCSIDRGCVAVCARDEDCDDGRTCTDDRCDGGTCVHAPVDARCPGKGQCGVGVCLGDAISDPSGCGTKPDAARCRVSEGCVADACAPLKTSCATDRDCGNGTLCDGVERCVGGACVRGERTTCVGAPCEHASCSATGVGDPWCRIVTLARCP